jgi:hypothetical protein
MRHFRIILPLLLLVAIPSLTAESEDWLNAEDTPAKITLLSNRRTLAITNGSTKQFSGYEFGCVSITSSEVARKLRFIKVSLNPGQSSFGDLDNYYEGIDICKKLASKFAVIKVDFADGESWHYATPKKQQRP